MGCGVSCARFLLIFFNILFWISGAVILGVGIWLRVDKSILDLIDFVEIDESDPLLKYAAYVLIGIGAFVFVVGFVGCFGAIKGSKFLLGLYIFFLVLVLIGELAAGIMALTYRRKIKDEFKGEWSEKLESDSYVDMSEDDAVYSPFGLSMNLVQWKFDCCGVNGISDYNNTNWPKNDSAGVARLFPFTCCVLKDDIDDPRKVQRSQVKDIDKCYTKQDDYIWMEGCYDGLMAWVDEHANILGGVAIGIACLEIFGFFFAICLCRAIDKDD